jgi:hypothetical protein
MWHIATSLGLTSSNVGFTRLFGGGLLGTVAGVVLAVAATAVAGFVFTWLRRRSDSLIAPIALHWSLNGMGALAAAWSGTCRRNRPRQRACPSWRGTRGSSACCHTPTSRTPCRRGCGTCRRTPTGIHRWRRP